MLSVEAHRRLHPVEPHPAPRLARGAASARWCAWSAATAPASPPRSARSWATCGRARAASGFRDEDDPRPAHPRDRPARARLRAGGQRDLPGSHGGGEHRDLDVDASRRAARRRAASSAPTRCSRCCGIPRAQGARDERRRAQDALGRPRARARSRDAAARRALRGSLPAIVPTVAEGSPRSPSAATPCSRRVQHPPRARVRHRLYVIERGEIIFAGPPDAVRRDPATMRVIGGTA